MRRAKKRVGAKPLGPGPTLEQVAGSLRKYGLSVREWNDATNEA